ncbi:protein kinase [Streptomyces sp. NPDC004111]|uniref:protein kinase domain-containing protein n=1 Tax=Streptomyces sp. NPDC004111 TaxID=3364690 RepID=UPI0036A1A9B1
MGNDQEQLLANRYRLSRVLGQGGMGAVWQAHDEHLGRDVAVKELRLPEHLGESERQNWIARFDREARAAARLKHPGIITVHDRISVPDGRPWIVMELVHGGSLADLVEAHGPLPPPSGLPSRGGGCALRSTPRTATASPTGTSSPPTSSSKRTASS